MKKRNFVISIWVLLSVLFSANVFATSEKRVDWNGRFEGEEEVPGWLSTMKRGNAMAYCQEFGLNSKINRQWLVPVGVTSYVGWEDGLVEARAQAFMALGQTICTTINSAIGSSLNNGAKNNIQNIAISSLTTVTGLEFEGYHWYEISNFAKVKLSALVAKKATQIESRFLKLRKIEDILQSFGYDGFMYENQNEGEGLSYAVFDDSQIIRADNVVDGARYNIAGYPDWTEDVLDDFEFGKLESALLDIESGTNANHYNRSASGEYIIQTDNKLIYTNGKHSNPDISKIIEFNSNYETEIDEMRRKIYEAEKGKSGIKMACRIIERAFGQGSVVEHTGHSNNANGKSTGLQKGTGGKGNSTNGGSKKQRRNRYVEEIRGASKQGLKAIQKASRKLKKSGIRYNIADEGGETTAIEQKNTEIKVVDLSAENELADNIKGLSGAEKYKVIRDYILDALDGTIVFSDGIEAKVDKSDAMHLAAKSGHKRVSYFAKIREIIDSAKLFSINDDIVHNKFNGFRYYKALVRLGEQEYPIYLNVGRAKNGDGYHLYDITKKVGEVKKQISVFERVKDLRSENDLPTLKDIPQETNSVKGKFSLKNDDIRYSLATDGILDLEDLWEDAKERYGTIPKGEIPVRDVDVPKKINEKDVVSRFARTMIEAGVTPDDAISEFEKAILDGTMTHEVITNKKASEKARETIEYLGFEEALNRWTVLSDSGKVGKKELALGMELYNQCITNKDVTNAMKIAAELAAEATRAGQTLQACRMLKQMTPDGQLYYLEKSIQKMNEEFKEKLGDKFKDIKLDEKLMGEFFGARDEEMRNAVYDKICQNIADQIPATLLDKWNSWRYLAMLGNPRTHFRNIVGNAVFVPAVRIKNYVGAVLENAAGVKTEERTKSLRKSKKAVEFAKKDFAIMEKTLQGENAKYAVTSDIEGKRTIFKTKWLEKLRTKNFDFLEMEDMWFLKAHYVDALARVITARKLDVDNLDAQALNAARAYAVKEAQAATYRDANSLAEGLNHLQRKLERSDHKAIRATSVLLEGIMPYKKTPLNIAKQGVQYSPVGVLGGTYKTLKKLNDGNAYSTTDIIDDFAKGLTGTGIMLLGVFLASIGALSGGAEEDKKKKEFDKMTGEQIYALKIGGKSYTIDWAAPLSLPLFTGVEAYKLAKETGFTAGQIIDAISTLPEPLLELSVFSGINDVIESAQYSKTNAISAVLYDMTASYFTQALPTIGGQISRILDDNKREYYYTDKGSEIPKGIQRIVAQTASKIPFASFLFAPSVDEWGREESYGNVLERTLENMVSPGYYAKEDYTVADKEIKRLYDETGDNAVLPILQQQYYKEQGTYYYMSADDYYEVKRIRGQESFKLVRELIKKKSYKQMSDEEKVKAIKKCYEKAGDTAKKRMLGKVKMHSRK